MDALIQQRGAVVTDGVVHRGLVGLEASNKEGRAWRTA